MTSSKVILVGAVSVVFGLYTLSLTRVGTSVGSAAEISVYQAKASDNAKSGVQRAVNAWSRTGNTGIWNGLYSSEGPFFLDPSGTDQGSFSYTATANTALANIGTGSPATVQLTVVSHGVYKAPSEPSTFQGHEVIRTAYLEFANTNYGTSGSPWYDLKLKAVYASVNYTREHQLDSLQQYKSNALGY